MEKIYMIDTISPFFTRHKKKKVNWSKIPFHQLEKKGDISCKTLDKIKNSFEIYIKKVKEMGYNSVSIDELCYMVIFDFYNPELKKKLGKYREFYRDIFEIVKQLDMRIFITTDVMFYNESIERYINRGKSNETKLLREAIINTFDSFPAIDGLIFRVGESDGVDIMGDFKSNLFLKKKKQTNLFIKNLLPVFEERSRYFIFRTWTVGAYGIGDIMWNEKTYKDVFNGIKSRNFIISMKYGDADFFRYLSLNPHFFLDGRKKIIELQTRREYEGFGEFPSFVGWDYKDYYEKIKGNKSIAGITVWCQTGGWSSFKNLTFLKKSSFWNELNTYVTIQIFKNGKGVEEAVEEFEPGVPGNDMVEFLRISDEIIKELLYDPYYSKLELYFNKVRIPPLVHIFWNNVTITDFIINFHRNFCSDPDMSVRKGFEALKKVKRLQEIAIKSGIDQYDYNFHYETFFIFAKARELIYFNEKKSEIKKFKRLVKVYKSKYPRAYKFHIKVSTKKIAPWFSFLLKILIRKTKDYRMVDKFLFNKFTFHIYMLLYKVVRKRFPKFLNNQAMPFETLLK